MPVPLLDLRPQHVALLPEIRRTLDELIGSTQFILGRYVEAFERELAAYCGARHAVGMSSGTDALLAAMMALNIGPGDEVVVPPFTFFATAGCVARLGARPAFADIRPDSYNLDPAAVEAVITPRTRAIIPVHLFGLSADMEPINAVARRHGLRVIEDAAQAIGATDGDRKVGALGHIGCLSFYPTKNLAAMGDAGACVTDDDQLADRLKVVRMHGQTGEYQHALIGGNFRIDALQAAVLSLKLPLLDGWSSARAAHACRYHQLLAGLPLELPAPGPAPGPAPSPAPAPGKRHVYNQFTVRVRDGRRDALMAHLKSLGIGHRVYYPLSLHLQPCFAYLGHRPGEFPVSEQATREVVSLPVYPEMTALQQDEVAQAIRSFFAA